MSAAATTSLPEEIGGERNWDYRYTWLRDASFTLNALYALGCTKEARVYARWLCDTTARHGLPLRVLYGIDGTPRLRRKSCPGSTATAAHARSGWATAPRPSSAGQLRRAAGLPDDLREPRRGRHAN